MEYGQLRVEIATALKAHDKLRVSILRQVLNEVDSAVKAAKGKMEAEESDVDAALKKTLKQTRETMEASEKAATDTQRTEDLRAQAEILDGYLPAQLDGTDLETRIDEIIAELGLSCMKGMGQLMGKLGSETGGNFDKASAAAYAKKKLG